VTHAETAKLVKRIKALWARHDALEREILLLERKLPDRVLRKIGSAAA
jgi:hypothetical protein